MHHKHSLMIYLISFLMPAMVFAGIGEETEAILRQLFPGADSIDFKELKVEGEAKEGAERVAGQKFILSKLYLWEIKKDEEVIGSAILDNVMGKVKPITYVVVFSADLSVIHTRVLRYREQYGGAIQNRFWLDQFIGFHAESNHRLGEDINGITGATLSADAITRGVKRVAVYLSLLINKN